MFRTNRELLGHISDDERLADGLPAGNRQRLIRIGRVHEPARHEMITGNFIQRPQHVRIDDPAPAQVEEELHPPDAVIAAGSWSGHGPRMVYTLCRNLRNTSDRA